MIRLVWLLVTGLVLIPSHAAHAGPVPINSPSPGAQATPGAASSAPSPSPAGSPAAGPEVADTQAQGPGEMPPPTAEENVYIEKLAKIKGRTPKNEAEDDQMRKEYTEALKEFCEKVPKSARALVALSSLIGSLSASGKVDEAEKLGEFLVKMAHSPLDTMRATMLLVDIHATAQQTPKAIQILEKTLAGKGLGEHEPMLKYRLATLLSESDRHDEALALLGGFLKQFPNHPRVGKFELKKADVLLSADRAKEALASLEAFRKLANNEEDKILATYFMGMAHLALSRHGTAKAKEAERKEALALLETLLEQPRKNPGAVNPYGAMAFTTMADVYIAGGDVPAAKKTLEEMAALYKNQPVGPFAERAIKELSWIGKPAPGFDVPGLDGKPVSLKALAGKIVLLDFWATWCGPCRGEVPHLRKLVQATRGKPFVIVSVSLDKAGQKEKVLKFISENKMDWVHIYEGKDSDDSIASRYEVTGIPATYLIDGQGKIIRLGLRGVQLKDTVLEAIEELGSGKPAAPASPAPSASPAR